MDRMNRKGIGNADILFLLKCLLLSYLLTRGMSDDSGAAVVINCACRSRSYPLPLSSFMWQPYFLQDFLREERMKEAENSCGGLRWDRLISV